MHRREFISGGLGAAAWLALAGLPARNALGAVRQGQSPLVLEVVGTGAPWKERDPSRVDCARLIGEMLGRLLESNDFPLDLLSGLFPEPETASIKIDAPSAGRITVPLALALGGLLLDADVSPSGLCVWDRESGPLHAAIARADLRQTPRILSVEESGGYGRPLRPGGDTPPFRIAALADATRRHATVTALSATDDGMMSPFVIESLAWGAVDWKGPGPPGGITAARVAADPALLPRAVLHIADLWQIPLGVTADGERQSWRACTMLLSRDAVALTRVAHTILANTRAVRNLGATPEPESLGEAARLGLGTADPAGIRWRKLSF